MLVRLVVLKVQSKHICVDEELCFLVQSSRISQRRQQSSHQHIKVKNIGSEAGAYFTQWIVVITVIKLILVRKPKYRFLKENEVKKQYRGLYIDRGSQPVGHGPLVGYST